MKILMKRGFYMVCLRSYPYIPIIFPDLGTYWQFEDLNYYVFYAAQRQPITGVPYNNYSKTIPKIHNKAITNKFFLE